MDNATPQRSRVLFKLLHSCNLSNILDSSTYAAYSKQNICTSVLSMSYMHDDCKKGSCCCKLPLYKQLHAGCMTCFLCCSCCCYRFPFLRAFHIFQYTAAEVLAATTAPGPTSDPQRPQHGLLHNQTGVGLLECLPAWHRQNSKGCCGGCHASQAPHKESGLHSQAACPAKTTYTHDILLQRSPQKTC